MNWGSLLLYSTVLLLLAEKATGCGSGRGASRRRGSGSQPLTPLKYKQYVPEISENTLGASGLSEGRIDREDEQFNELTPNYNADIIFKDEEGTGADRLMTQRCKDKLNALAILVMNQWPGVKLRVTEGWDEDGHHAADSLHYEGRAVDITTSDRDREKYGLLARLAVEAGYDWVFYESRAHIHCSVKADESEAAKAGTGCFHGKSLVYLDNGESKHLENVEIGDRVLASNSQGDLEFSQVLLHLDRRPEQRALFYVVETESPTPPLSSITLTPSHLIYTSDSNVTALRHAKLTYASNIHIGQYLYTRRSGADNSGRGVPVRVTGVRQEVKTGIYAPLTSSGSIVVDNHLASCYAMVEHEVAHLALSPMRALHAVVPSTVWNSLPCMSAEWRGIHWYARYLSYLGNLLLGDEKMHSGGILL